MHIPNLDKIIHLNKKLCSRLSLHHTKSLAQLKHNKNATINYAFVNMLSQWRTYINKWHKQVLLHNFRNFLSTLCNKNFYDLALGRDPGGILSCNTLLSLSMGKLYTGSLSSTILVHKCNKCFAFSMLAMDHRYYHFCSCLAWSRLEPRDGEVITWFSITPIRNESNIFYILSYGLLGLFWKRSIFHQKCNQSEHPRNNPESTVHKQTTAMILAT